MTSELPPMPSLPDKSVPNQETEFMSKGRWVVSDVEEPAFREFKKKYGLEKKLGGILCWILLFMQPPYI